MSGIPPNGAVVVKFQWFKNAHGTTGASAGNLDDVLIDCGDADPVQVAEKVREDVLDFKKHYPKK